MKKLLVTLLLLLCFLTLVGCKNASELHVAKVSDIQSLQYEIVMHKENNPVPLLLSNAKDKVIIEKITSWMGQAKSEGFDNQVPTQSIPPNFLTIKLTNGSTYRLSPGNNDIVYVQIVDTNKTLRFRSSDLNTWLRSGWEKDTAQVLPFDEAVAAALVLKDHPDFPKAGEIKKIETTAGGPGPTKLNGELKTMVEKSSQKDTYVVTLTKAWNITVNGNEAKSVWKYKVTKDAKVELISSEENDKIINTIK
jgi:hypothetical protein